MVEFLVDRGADVNVRDKNGSTLLGAAFWSLFMDSETKTLGFLKDKGAK